MNPSEQIKLMLNKPYESESSPIIHLDKDERIDIELDKEICWTFCRHLFKLYDIELPELPHQGIKRIEQGKIVIPSIVLFECGNSWHSGVIWPDGLHFVHAKFELPLENQKNDSPRYIIRKEKITRWPWNVLTEGFYIYAV